MRVKPIAGIAGMKGWAWVPQARRLSAPRPPAGATVPAARLVEAQRPLQGFNLLRWFSLVSLLALIPVAAAIGTVLSNFVTRQALHRDAAAHRAVHRQLRGGRGRAGRGPKPGAAAGPARGQQADGAVAGRRRPRARAHTFSHLESLPDALLVSVYARDRLIVWSTNASLTGTHVDYNDELEEAFRTHNDVALHHSRTVGGRSEQRFVVEPGSSSSRTTCRSPDRRARDGGGGGLQGTGPPDALDPGRPDAGLVDHAGGRSRDLPRAVRHRAARPSRVLAEQQEQLVAAESQVYAGEAARALAHSLRKSPRQRALQRGAGLLQRRRGGAQSTRRTS
jgi:two-component system sensor histidine kinase HydH